MRGTLRLAAIIVTTLMSVCGVIAATVHLAFAGAARQWLAFPFTGIPARPSEAATIFLHNLRALVAVCGLLLIAQSGLWNANAAGPRPAYRIVRGLGEIVLAAAILANLVVVGASLGAYDARMIRAALPHGPVELGAYSLTLALYLQGRNGRLETGHIAAVITVSAVALAVAAVLETYANV